MCHKWPRICSTCCKHFPVLSSVMTYHRIVTRLTRQVSLVEQELLTLPGHLSSPPVFSGVLVARSLVLYVCFVDRCLTFCTISFGHCIVYSSSIYGFWLPLWHLQTPLTSVITSSTNYNSLRSLCLRNRTQVSKQFFLWLSSCSPKSICKFNTII
jgi:hypothetical protein